MKKAESNKISIVIMAWTLAFIMLIVFYKSQNFI